MGNRKCFVIMPFGGDDEKEKKKWWGIYSQFFRAPLEAINKIKVTRGDEIRAGGRITKQVVDEIANSEFAIVDLTGANANVTYELGVRHALSRSGTILVCQRAFEERLPFNFRGERIILYDPDIGGVDEFVNEIADWIADFDATLADNIVHQSLPQLPPHPASSTDANVVAWSAALQTRLATGQVAHASGERSESPKSRLTRFATAIRSGNSTPDLVKKALDAAQASDLVKFIDAVEALAKESVLKPSSEQFHRLIRAASLQFDAHELATTIADLAREAYPDDDDLQTVWLALLRRGTPQDRQEALKRLEEQLGFDRTTKKFANRKIRELTNELKVYFDLLLRSGDAQVVLDGCDALDQVQGKTPHIARERARAMQELYGELEALPAFKESALMEGADDVAAIWYGNTLNNLRRYIDAAEVYLLACIRDANDSAGFAHFVQSLARNERLTGGDRTSRPAPNGVGTDEIIKMIEAAVACGRPTAEELVRLQDAIDTFGLDPSLLDVAGEQVKSTVRERRVLAEHLYEVFRTDVTQQTR